MHLKSFIIILGLSLLTACGAETPSSPRPPLAAPSPGAYPEKCVLHDKSFLEWDAVTVQDAAEATVVIFPIAFCFSPDAEPVIGELRHLNPDIQIIGKLTLLGVGTLWPDTNYLRETLPFELEYYEAVSDDWAYTDAGDTLMLWPDMIFLKPLQDGALNHELISEITALVAQYQVRSGNAIDGIMHDYFMKNLFINYLVRDRVVGEPDLDEDGIPTGSDPEEQARLVLWEKAYVQAIRDRFGPDFIQIGNGHLPQDDADLAGMLNGLFYEDFPNNLRGYTDREGLFRLFDVQEEGYLAQAKGRTWTILTNVTGGANNLFGCISSMLADCFYIELQGSNIFTGWTLDIAAGRPLGERTVEGDPDSILTVRRSFSRGEARISFAAHGSRREVIFETNSIQDW